MKITINKKQNGVEFTFDGFPKGYKEAWLQTFSAVGLDMYGTAQKKSLFEFLNSNETKFEITLVDEPLSGRNIKWSLPKEIAK